MPATVRAAGPASCSSSEDVSYELLSYGAARTMWDMRTTTITQQTHCNQLDLSHASSPDSFAMQLWYNCRPQAPLPMGWVPYQYPCTLPGIFRVICTIAEYLPTLTCKRNLPAWYCKFNTTCFYPFRHDASSQAPGTYTFEVVNTPCAAVFVQRGLYRGKMTCSPKSPIGCEGFVLPEQGIGKCVIPFQSWLS